MKDNDIARLVNNLKQIAVECHGHGSLREKISKLIVPAVKGNAGMEWINADDRLPEKGCWLIVFNCMDVNAAGWDNEEKRFFIGCEWLNGVTHWMPLPESPKD